MTETKAVDALREQVRDRYAAAAITVTSGQRHASSAITRPAAETPADAVVQQLSKSTTHSAQLSIAPAT